MTSNELLFIWNQMSLLKPILQTIIYRPEWWYWLDYLKANRN